VTRQNVLLIDLRMRETTCHVCGADTPEGFGVPTYEGEVVPLDWPGAWGGAPACKRCYNEYEQGEHVTLRWDDLNAEGKALCMSLKAGGELMNQDAILSETYVTVRNITAEFFGTRPTRFGPPCALW